MEKQLILDYRSLPERWQQHMLDTLNGVLLLAEQEKKLRHTSD